MNSERLIIYKKVVLSIIFDDSTRDIFPNILSLWYKRKIISISYLICLISFAIRFTLYDKYNSAEEYYSKWWLCVDLLAVNTVSQPHLHACVVLSYILVLTLCSGSLQALVTCCLLTNFVINALSSIVNCKNLLPELGMLHGCEFGDNSRQKHNRSH